MCVCMCVCVCVCVCVFIEKNWAQKLGRAVADRSLLINTGIKRFVHVMCVYPNVWISKSISKSCDQEVMDKFARFIQLHYKCMYCSNLWDLLISCAAKTV